MTRWISQESQPWIAQAEHARASERAGGLPASEQAAPSAAAPEAEDVLYRDWRRPSRIAWGALATVLWVGAAGGAFLVAVGLSDGDDGVATVIAVATLTVVLGASAAWLLWRLHRSGGALTRALAYWVRLPWLRGEPRGLHPTRIGASRTHTDPAVALHWCAAGVTGLMAVGGAALAVQGAVAAADGAAGAELGLAAFGAVLAAGMLPTTVGLVSGIRRAVFAYSDPRQALERGLGYGPPGPVPSRHAPRSVREDAAR